VKYHITYISPLFYKKEATHQTSILQKNQENNPAQLTTNALRGRISPYYLGHAWSCFYHLF